MSGIGMRHVASGGLLWLLLRHELRLAWRGIGGKSLWFIGIAGGLLWLAIHGAAWALLTGMAAAGKSNAFQAPQMVAGAAFWLFTSILLSQTMAHAVAALFDRGDLDLLLSSPLPARAILMVRGLAIAVSACLLPAFLMLPFAHVGLFTGQATLLAMYPVVATMALGSTAVGILLTMGLVYLLGARRAKVAAQVLGALFGAGFFLLLQWQNLIPKRSQEAWAGSVKRAIEPGGWLAPDSLIWSPGRAMLGDVWALLVILLAGVGGFIWAVNLTNKRFARGSQEAVTGGRTSAAKPWKARPFRTGMTRLMLQKEWRLLLRDPHIISQTLLQMLYLLPMVFLAFRNSHNAWLVIPALVMLAATLAGNLAWLTIAAEDAPELLGSAPMPISHLRVLKAVAAVLPVMLILLPLILYWVWQAPYSAWVLAVCGLGATAGAALTHIWNPRQGNRRDMKQRYQQNRLANMLEAAGSLGWAGVAACMSGFWYWLPLPLLMVGLNLGASWWMGRATRNGGVA